jgi:hypothetical protein
MAQAVECLFCKGLLCTCESLSSNSSPPKQKQTKKPSVGKYVEKSDPCALLVGMGNGAATVENN